jgi:hypothetical protein
MSALQAWADHISAFATERISSLCATVWTNQPGSTSLLVNQPPDPL